MICWQSLCESNTVGLVRGCELTRFSAGYVVSAIFICIEYQRLGMRYRQHHILRMSFWVKLAFIIVEVGLAIGTFRLSPTVQFFSPCPDHD